MTERYESGTRRLPRNAANRSGRIPDLLGSRDKFTVDASCLLEEFFGASGFEPCPESDHGICTFLQPVRRIAFDSQIDHSPNRTFHRIAADGHVVMT